MEPFDGEHELLWSEQLHRLLHKQRMDSNKRSEAGARKHPTLTFSSTTVYFKVVPPSCCILDFSVYPRILPMDSHCIFVPTSYNSYWLQVSSLCLLKLFNNQRNIIVTAQLQLQPRHNLNKSEIHSLAVTMCCESRLL